VRQPEQRRRSQGVFDKAVSAAKALAQSQRVAFEAHVFAGHPVPTIAEFVGRGGYDLLAIWLYTIDLSAARQTGLSNLRRVRVPVVK
jgi:nucleotide-binding universal stress UspA family protein